MQALVTPPEGQVWRFYYYAGGQRVALRVNQGAASDLYWLLGDHGVCASANTGSTTLAAVGTAEAGELRYKAWGETRYASGRLTLACSYRPYREELASEGDGASPYGFTGEWRDPSGLIHLRARYYSPSIGRFISKDLWEGNVYRPLSLDEWNYKCGNMATCRLVLMVI